MTAPREMTVGVNLLWCLPGAVGGSEEYLVRQLTGLREVAPEIRARLFVVPGFAAAHRELTARQELVVASLDARRRSRRIVTEATWLPSRLEGVDLVHHGGGTVPPRSPRPIVLTIHDLQYRTFPQYLSAVKRQYLRMAIPRSVGRAAIVAVPTEYVRSTVIDAYGPDPERVVVVPHGVDVPDRLTDDDELRARYGLGDRRYLVYPALTHPHKQHGFLLELLAGAWNDPELALVLLGGRGLVEDDVAATIGRLGLTDRVVRPGRVPDADRDGLVAGAEALVFPSEYEGFGAPVLEAMVLGTPVICSDRAALPEVVGDAAIVRPLDPEAWGPTLDELAARRDELITAGHRRAALFTTQTSGAALADAYRRCLAL
ncbi:MAG: glycosyltransferase family 1 protein [Ilumatobacteraceae bacterium]